MPCIRCDNVFTIAEELVGRKVRCQRCGQIQRIATTPVKLVPREPQPGLEVYALSPELPAATPALKPVIESPPKNKRTMSARQPRGLTWRRLVRAGVGESSLLERESLGLIVLSAADLLVTYALLRRGPAFYESNPVAQWFFVRWNIAGMALFKFSAMGLVVVIGEIVERHRPGWGRSLVLMSCLATAAVVFYGLRLLLGHGDNGAPLG